MPKAKDEDKVIAIHQAAMSLMIEQGYLSLKMAEVAKKASIATGTMYIYYSSKEELINDVYLQTKIEILNIMLDEAHVADTFQATFQNIWKAYFKFCLTQPHKMLFVEQLFHSGIIRSEILNQINAKMQYVDAFINEGQKRGVIKNTNIEIIKAYMNGSIHEIIKTSLDKELNITDKVMNQIFEMTWNSLKHN
jgi:TetR/AcrR family transcriptional regulator, repressor of fatR-cypB operon